MRKILVVLLLGIFNIYPTITIAQEDGWKNLKWGMTVNEIKKIYVDEQTGAKCQEELELSPLPPLNLYFYDIIERYDKSYKSSNAGPIISKYIVESKLVTTLTCMMWETGILIYKNKFFGKATDLLKMNFGDKKIQDEIMRQLKEKYPQGRVSHKEFIGPVRKAKYLAFEYTSNKIIVFNSYMYVYFLNSQTVNEIVNIYLEGKQKESKKETDKRKLF